MKEESDKLKHAGHKSHESAFGSGAAARKNLLDDLLGVQELVAEKVHAFGKVIETEIVPSIEGMVRWRLVVGWVMVVCAYVARQRTECGRPTD